MGQRANRSAGTHLAWLRSLFAAAFVFSGTAGVRACQDPSIGSGATFPLRIQKDHRYLEDAAGKPFFLQGDTAWSLIAQLSQEDADLYLRDRKARGFNAILVNLLEHRFASNAPRNAYGDGPFTIPGNFATPNDAYFRHADRVLRRACELGIVVLLAPAYAGSGGGDEGWYQEMVANGSDKLRDYGRFLGNRYRGMDNILWVAGGDFNPPDKTLTRAIVDGLKETDPQALHTAHAAPGSAALDYWSGEPWLDVNNVYTYDPVHLAAHAQLERHPTVPFLLMESAYESEHDADAQRIRTQAYQALLSGASGQVFGNNPIWHFDGPGLYDAPTGWREALDSAGTRSMTVLQRLISSHDWWRLEPDVDNAFLLGGRGLSDARALAAVAADRSFALVYLPTGRTVTLDLSRLDGSSIEASWLDPSSGSYAAARGSPLSATVQKLKSPTRDGAIQPDWVLELTARKKDGESDGH